MSKGILNEKINCDLTKFPAIVYLAFIFLISRIPFINLGFRIPLHYMLAQSYSPTRIETVSKNKLLDEQTENPGLESLKEWKSWQYVLLLAMVIIELSLYQFFKDSFKP